MGQVAFGQTVLVPCGFLILCSFEIVRKLSFEFDTTQHSIDIFVGNSSRMTTIVDDVAVFFIFSQPTGIDIISFEFFPIKFRVSKIPYSIGFVVNKSDFRKA